MIFQVQKISNNNFSSWREPTDTNITHPYDWDRNDGMPAADFYPYSEGGVQGLSGSGALYSSFIPVVNDTSFYTISGMMGYVDATVSGLIIIRELNEGLTTIIDNNWYVPLTSSAVSHTITCGGASSGADIIFNTNTVGVQILIKQRTTSWFVKNISMFGYSIEIDDRGIDLPTVYTENLMQKSGDSYSGKITAPASYGAPLKLLKLNISGLTKVNHDKLYTFLTHDDINYSMGSFIYTDHLGDTYFGKFIQDSFVMEGEHYQCINTDLTFMELPW